MRVVATAKTLKPATKKQVMWVYKNCLEHFAFRTKSGRTTCLDCGHTFEVKSEERRVNNSSAYCQCPKCKAKLKIENTQRRKETSSSYFTIADTKDGLQVLRVFLLNAYYEKGKEATLWHTEIAQYWMNEDGKTEVIARKRTYGYYQDSFLYGSPMEIRRDSDVYQYIATCPIYPDVKVIPQLERNGFEGDFYGIAPLPLFKALLTDSRIETLTKEKRIEELRYFMEHRGLLKLCWQSYLIARRNHYNISDFQMWCDLVSLLHKQDKDLHNPHYICLADLRTEHDKWLNAWNRKQARQREEEQRQWQAREREREYEKLMQMDEQKEEYIKAKKSFLNIVLTDGLITLHVLQNIEEFYEEGCSMSHCVYACSYFEKENSVILSARIDDKRVETVEFSLKSFSVVQCHGKHNSNTEYHDRIVNLVNSNADVFRKRMITA